MSIGAKVLNVNGVLRRQKMDDAKKMQLIEELNKAVNPELSKSMTEEDRVKFLQSSRTLEISKEAQVNLQEEELKEKKITEDEAFENLIQRLNEQKNRRDKR